MHAKAGVDEMDTDNDDKDDETDDDDDGNDNNDDDDDETDDDVDDETDDVDETGDDIDDETDDVDDEDVDEVKYFCDLCDCKVYNNKTFKCNQCDHMASKKSSLKVHVKPHHEGVKFACEKCEMKYKAKISLASHVQPIHEGQSLLTRVSPLCHGRQFIESHTQHQSITATR